MRLTARRHGHALALVVAAVIVGCGSQLPRAEIESAAGGAAGPVTSAGDRASGGLAGEGDTAGARVAVGAEATRAESTGAGDTPVPGARADGSSESAESPAGGGAVTPPPADRPAIKLGHIGTYSGLLGAIFTGGREAVNAWAQHVNANGGLDGHPVEVVTADDQGDPSINLSLTRDMVENQGVIAFVGNIVPLSLTGSRSYVEQKGIPLVGGDLTDPAWFSSPMFFPQGARLQELLAGSARLAVRKGGTRVGLLYCEVSACSVADSVYKSGVVEQAGGTLVYSARISLAQPDFTGECLSIGSNRADVVAVAADGNTLRRIARSCRQQGVQVKWVSFGLAIQNSIADDPNLDGLIGVASTFPFMLTDGPAATYGRAMATYAPRVALAGATAAVWGSGTLLQAASRNLPPGKVTSTDILAGLYALNGETLGGLTPPLTFARGEPAPPLSCHWELALRDRMFVAPNGLGVICE